MLNILNIQDSAQFLDLYKLEAKVKTKHVNYFGKKPDFSKCFIFSIDIQVQTTIQWI